MKTIIIAEIGVNHDGKINKMKKLIKNSKSAGADFVKIQVFDPNEIVIKKSKTAKYQRKVTNNQYKLLKKYELSKNDIIKINAFCKKIKIKLLSTCFDLKSFKICKKILSTSVYKIGSGDLTNLPLIYEIAKSKKKIILSTGMSDLFEIDQALKTIFFAYKFKNISPSLKEITKINLNKKNLKFLKKKVSILHCISVYPAKLYTLNLNFIKVLKKRYELKIGFSDHSMSIHSSSIAVAMGAEIIEKHITLNNYSRGPDHSSSLNPSDFKKLVLYIRDTEKMIGSNKTKFMSAEERNNAKIVKKSLYARKNIKKGEKFTTHNLSVKRPKNGKNPGFLWSLIGKKSKKNYKVDQLI